MTDDLGRLAAAIRHRRTQDLGISTRLASERARISRTAWVDLEAGRAKPQERNHPGIERALGWAPGSIAAIIAGGEPTLASDQPTAPLSADLDEWTVREVERIKAMPMSYGHKQRLLRSVLDMYMEEQERAQQRAEPEDQGGQREAS